MTDEQIVIVQEITLEDSFDRIASLVSNLNAAQQTRLTTVANNWEANGYGTREGDLLPFKGEILFNQVGRMRKIRFNVRLMLGLPAVSDTELDIAALTGTMGTNTPGGMGRGGRGGSGGGAGDNMTTSVFRGAPETGFDEFNPA